MTDIRARISGVVLNRLADYGIRIDRETADSVAEAVMAMPDVAIVELPEPEDGNFYYQSGYVFADDGEITGKRGTEFGTPQQVRTFAAALLAAAVQAQEEK